MFFSDVRVPAANLVGPLNGGWKVINGSLGHERTMMWLGFADRIANVIADFRPTNALERDGILHGGQRHLEARQIILEISGVVYAHLRAER